MLGLVCVASIWKNNRNLKTGKATELKQVIFEINPW